MRAYAIVLLAAISVAAGYSVPAHAAAAAKAIDIMPIASTKSDAKAAKTPTTDAAKPAKTKRKRAPKKTPPADAAK